MPISHASTSPISWLSSLKAAQLNRIAFVTGVSSSGTKPVLIRRLNDALQSSPSMGADDETAACGTCQHGLDGRTVQSLRKDGRSSRAMSILSIDMGIRNLAFAHLIVPPSPKDLEQPPVSALPILNAWTRLAISDFPSSPQMPALKFRPGVVRKTITKHSQTIRIASSSSNQDENESSLTESKGNTDKESFAPELYASHAYTLITSLVATYRPTHILIERQRFRSGGGSAVQEWTIRVGVFEGMLYAVLQTLIREANRRDLDIVVQGVEPQRVARYWIEEDLPASSRQPGTKANRKITSREGKNAKINVVARWLTAWRDLHSPARTTPERSLRIQLGANSQADIVASQYLKKWNGKSRGRAGACSLENCPTAKELDQQNKTKKAAKQAPSPSQENNSAEEPDPITPGPTSCSSHSAADIGKLDDLADCLLQGIAWLDWKNMRAKIGREGLAAVPFQDGGGGCGGHRKV